MNTSSPSQQVLQTLSKGLLYSALIVTPLLVLPISQNIFDTPKTIFVVLVTLLITCVWAVWLILKKKVVLHTYAVLAPLLLMNALILTSSFLSSVPFLENLSGFYGAWFVLNLLVIIGSQFVQIKKPQFFMDGLSIVGIVLSIVAVMQTVGIGPSTIFNRLFGIQVADSFLFTLSGSPFVTAVLLFATVLTIAISVGLRRNWKSASFQLVAAGIMSAGLLFHVVQFVRSAEFRPVALPFWANWSIAVDGLKNVQTAVVGRGPQGFIDAYTALRPVELNATPQWLLTFQVGTNTPLTLLVTMGVLGVAAWFWLGFLSLKMLKKTPTEAQPIAIFFLICWGIQLFIPFNLVLLTVQLLALLFWIAGLQSQHDRPHFHLPIELHFTHGSHEPGRGLSLALAVILFITAGGIGVFASSVVASEWYFFQSLQAAQRNEGNQTYELQQRAIQTHPYRDQYRRAYAQTNFALANSLSSRENLTDQDRTTVTQLLQQSLREARAATQLNPDRSVNWKTLAEIYRAITGTTDGADQWAVASYVQAIRSNPNDPTLRVDLGGVFFILKNYPQAEQLFSQAAQLKPDYANAFYNLANALSAQQKDEQALQAYERTLALLDPSSEDYIKAQQEMSVVNERVTKAREQTQRQEVTTAKPTGSPTPTPAVSATPVAEQPAEAPLSDQVSDTNIPAAEPNQPSLPSPTPAPTVTP